MLAKYILVGKKPVLEPNTLKWAEWLETADRQVAVTHIPTLDGEIIVSTAFLGLDHNFSGVGKPLLFETMIFGGKHDGEQLRTETWAQAKKAHRELEARVYE